MTSTPVVAFLSHVLAAAGGGAVALIAFIKWFGDKWIGHRFDRRLAAFKADRDQEFAQLRQKHETDLAHLNHRLTSRISKIHEKEFEVLPKAWLHVNRTHGSLIKIYGFSLTVDANKLSDQELEEVLAQCKFSASKEQEIRKATGRQKQKAFDEGVFNQNVDEAVKNQRLLQNYLIQNQIFMTRDLHEQFDGINTDLRHAVYAYRLQSQPHDSETMRRAYALGEGVKAKLPSLERAIQDRLHYSDA